MTLLGIDIGGTKTSVCLGTPAGEIAASQRIPSYPGRGFDNHLKRTLELVDGLLQAQGTALEDIAAVGISAPGPLSVSKGLLLCAPNMEGWKDIPIVEEFRNALGRDVFMNNDANACALAEWMFGEFSGADPLVYLTMSTGLGAGIIANGRLLQGANDMAGEVGFHVIDPDGPDSPCGHRGSFEAFCGGKNVAARLKRIIPEKKIKTVIVEKAGGQVENIDFKALVEAVRVEDTFAMETWEDYIEHLAQGIANLIMILNPKVIVLGTIAIHAGDLLLEPLGKSLKKYVMDAAMDVCSIAPSALGTNIGDLSALAVAVEGTRERGN